MTKRIAIFRSQLLPRSETFIRDQVGALKEWTPILFGFNETEDGLAVPSIERKIFPAGSRVLDAWRFWSGAANPAIVRWLRELDVRLVHAHFGIGATEIWPSVKAAGLPLLVTLHGNDINIYREWWEAGHGGLRRRIYPRRLLRMARDPNVHFVAVSEAIRRRAIEYGIPNQKITVAFIGVDTKRFKPGGLPLNQRRKRILFVGRMVEKKAPMLMVRVFAQVRENIPDAELVMIGDGPLLGETKRLANELSAPVLFLETQSSDEILTQLHEARVFCLPSVIAGNGDAEGLPISLVEAQACGVPSVTTMHSGNLEIVLDGLTGRIVPENATAALSSAILFALTDTDFLASAKDSSSWHIQRHFDLSRKTAELEAFYEMATAP